MRHHFRVAFAALLLCASSVAAADYDPLSVESAANRTGRVVDISMTDADRGREIPIRAYLPVSRGPSPVVLFSHGLGGSRENNAYMGEHWSDRGYVCVFMQHIGSDVSVWRDAPVRERRQALNAAANLENFRLRVEDVRAVIDQLEAWNSDAGHGLRNRMDLSRIGMSGHSFGAHTTQAVSGQSFPLVEQRYTDERIDAACAFSPSAPARGDAGEAFGSVTVPWLLMTGTNDTSPIGNATGESRMNVYPHLPSSVAHYELVLHEAEHSAFSDRALPGDQLPRNPGHHRAILAISTAFWDACLREDAAAIEWLQGEGARQVLEDDDRWQVVRGR
jgi:predicted dienelactone hydrolase